MRGAWQPTAPARQQRRRGPAAAAARAVVWLVVALAVASLVGGLAWLAKIAWTAVLT